MQNASHGTTAYRAMAVPARALLRSAAMSLLVAVALPSALQATAPLPADQAVDWCRDADSNVDFCEVRTLTLETRDGRLSVNARPNGSVRVEGWDGSDVRVEARVTVRARNSGAAEELADEVEVRARPGSLSSEGPRTRGRESWSVSYRVQVPVGTDLELESTNGSIRVEGVAGGVAARSTNGSVRLSDVAGGVRVRTTNGSIQTAFGPGSLPDRDMELRTTNGSVTLTLPDGAGAQIEARTTNGRINTDFPLTVQGRLGRRVSGVLGDGGPEIRLTTTNGSIRIERR